MASQRTALSVFWTSLTSLVDGELVTMELLYKQGLHRIHDSAKYALEYGIGILSLLASTTDGTQATITGSVDISTFDFQSGLALIGKTLVIDEDTAAAQTVTFNTAITNPSELLLALAAGAPTNLSFSYSPTGRLTVKSNTVGSGSTLAAITGTSALALLGAQTYTPGSGDANDGTSKIGLGPIPSAMWVGGTLRDFIQNGVAPAVAKIMPEVLDYSADDADQTIAPTKSTIVLCASAVTSSRTYALSLPSTDGLFAYFRRPGSVSGTLTITGISAADIGSGSFPITSSNRAITLFSLGGAWRVYMVGDSN